MSQEKTRTDVMISSTTDDLIKHREHVAAAITRARMQPSYTEIHPPTDLSPLAFSLRMVDEADIYILLVSFRYGSIPNGPDNPNKLSFTELEYHRAVERKRESNLPIFVFLMHPGHKTVVGNVEQDPKKKRKLDAFRKHLSEQHHTVQFESPEELRELVYQALKDIEPLPETPQPGNGRTPEAPTHWGSGNPRIWVVALLAVVIVIVVATVIVLLHNSTFINEAVNQDPSAMVQPSIEPTYTTPTPFSPSPSEAVVTLESPELIQSMPTNTLSPPALTANAIMLATQTAENALGG
jgi:hypothetical protein